MEGGGGGEGCWCKSSRGHTFCAIENEGLHKILQPFSKGHVFCCIAISILQNETKVESIIRQILFFHQNDGIPNQHNMVLAVFSP